MNNIFIIIFVGIAISELGGFIMIRMSRTNPRFSTFKRLGFLVCILGLCALILGIIAEITIS